MCLLVTSTASNLRNVLLNTAGLLENIYNYNSDGLGIMYHTTKGVKVIKLLPKSAEETRHAIEALPTDDRQVACHWRMKTHGLIDKENCHPYPIGHGAHMMHNGVLHTGNKKDTTKSDTWHFAKDYLSTLDADTLHNPQYLKLLGEYIENNRFVIMTADGRMSWVNDDQGVEASGIKFSNTYAWSPEILIPSYRVHRSTSWANQSWFTRPASQLVHYKDYEGLLPEDDDVKHDTLNAVYAYDESALTKLLRSTDKEEVIDYILDGFLIELSPRFQPDDWTENMVALADAWCDANWKFLGQASPELLANALLYCCDCTPVDEIEWEEDDIDNTFADLKELV